MNGGHPPEPPAAPNVTDHLADEYHDRFKSARHHLRKGYPPEVAAIREDLPLDLFVDALDGDPEDIRGERKITCDACGERVTVRVAENGGSASGERRRGQPMGVQWCAWDETMPKEYRPEGWRSMLPSDGFPCPLCGEEQTGDTISVSRLNKPPYPDIVRCGSCGGEFPGDDSE